MDKVNEQDISRRGFLKGSAAVAALGGLSLAGCATGAASGQEDAPAHGLPESWDKEVDVVVLGTGTIIPAALRAHDHGLEVLVLEKHPTYFGGTTNWLLGGFSCPNSTLAIEAGMPEIPRDMLKEYMELTAEGQYEDEVQEAMLDNYVPAADYLYDECDFDLAYKAGKAFNLYTPHSGLEEKYSDVCCHVTVNPHPSGIKPQGRSFCAFAKDALDERGIEVMFGAAGKKLIYKGNPLLGDGEVVGVYAETAEGTIAIKARYGVVIGTGGFDHNAEMVKHYLPAPICGTVAIETNTGDGHLMAMEVGADLRNMNASYRMAYVSLGEEMEYKVCDVAADDGTANSEQVKARVFLNPGQPNSLIVNKHGERFGNESTCYDLFSRNFDKYDTGFAEWRNIPGYLICDSGYTGSFGNGLPSLPEIVESGELPAYVHRYDTLEDLAAGEGIDGANLLSAVDRFNGFCETGVDLDWNRGGSSWDRNSCGNAKRVESGELKNPCLGPVKDGPFYCVKIYPGMMQTKGGLRINGNAQVMNVEGNPIPRLYAGSNCIANPLGRGYGWGGGTMANGYIVGYIAANHLATLTSWE